MQQVVVIDVNETKHRYYLCREQTHLEMAPQFQVKFSVVGKYYPNRAMATEGAPPLQLHIHGEEEGVKRAVAWVQTIIEKGPPSLRPAQEKSGEKYLIPFSFEETHTFALRNAIQGAQGENLRYISTQCGVSIALRGRGSGAIMTAEDQKESFHLFLTFTTEQSLREARVLLDDLMKVVEFEYVTSRQLGYFTALGGMFAPDQILVQAAKGEVVAPQHKQPLPVIGTIPMYYSPPTWSGVYKGPDMNKNIKK